MLKKKKENNNNNNNKQPQSFVCFCAKTGQQSCVLEHSGVQCSCDYWAEDRSEMAFSWLLICSQTTSSLPLFEQKLDPFPDHC